MLARVMQSLVFTTPNFIHKDLVHETERIAPRVKITQTTLPRFMPPWRRLYCSSSAEKRERQFGNRIASGCKTLASPAQAALVEHAASDSLCDAALSF